MSREREVLERISKLTPDDPWVRSWKDFARGVMALVHQALEQPFDAADLPDAPWRSEDEERQ